MTTINLRKYYPWYTRDELVEVPDEVAAFMDESRRDELAQRRQVYRQKAEYSLDAEDGIEEAITFSAPTPYQLMERKERFILLWNALNSLPPAQGRRVDAVIILGMSYRAVARVEGVAKTTVVESVECGLANMKKFLKNFRD